MALARLPGVDDHGDACGDALVAAAGIDDHRQLAAVHPGVAGRGGPGPELVVQAVLMPPEQGLADVGPVGMAQPLLRNGHVIGDLPLQQGSDGGEVCVLGVVRDPLHGEDAPVCLAFPGLVQGLFQQGLAVSPQADQVGVVPRDADEGDVLPGEGGDHDVEDMGRVGKADLYGDALQGRGQGVDLLRRGPGEDLQLRSGVPDEGPGQRGGPDTPESPGVGDHHALHVFQDVAADLHQQPLRLPAQKPACLGGGIGDGDRLRAARGGDQLLRQDLLDPATDLLFHDSFLPIKIKRCRCVAQGKSV